MTLLYLSIGLIIVIVILSSYENMKINRLRKEGKYPEKGKVTEEDISILLKTGNEILAIKAYRELHNVGLKEAKEKIDKMKKEA